MRFNRHSPNLPHALLSPSKPAWLNYSDDKMERSVVVHMDAARGTRLHDVAKQLIDLRIKQDDNGSTFSAYVNDCIGFRMETEQILFYSTNAYGTADAISYSEKLKKLRIFDLKNGLNQANMMQLKIYAALFCLEYLVKPFDIEIDLRIYQNDAIKGEIADPVEITYIMDRIKTCDRIVNETREEHEA